VTVFFLINVLKYANLILNRFTLQPKESDNPQKSSFNKLEKEDVFIFVAF
tara:strand:- start:11809 stop:11958 length:150 start_codon:yes stop_codon:yes gene_type:complete